MKKRNDIIIRTSTLVAFAKYVGVSVEAGSQLIESHIDSIESGPMRDTWSRTVRFGVAKINIRKTGDSQIRVILCDDWLRL